MGQVDFLQPSRPILAAKIGPKTGRLVVVSNRVPVPTASGTPAAGGLAVALDAALKARGGLWFGWSGKTNDMPESATSLRSYGPVSYAVADLSRRDLEEFYHGFANRALWPICHYRLDLAEYSAQHTAGFFRVNGSFARRLAKLLDEGDAIWVHDYHLIPLARALRDMGFSNRLGFFLHVPWPPSDVASGLPAYEELLRSFAAYDLVGFQTELDAKNFIDCIEKSGSGRALGDGWCEAFGRRFRVGAFPISIDTGAFAEEARLAEHNTVVKRTRASLDGKSLIIGVDRLDYTKGILERINSFAAFLERHPDMKKRTVLLQITPKSRSEVPAYVQIQRAVAEQVGNTNGKYGDLDWTPVQYMNKTMSRTALAGLYRMARVGLVTPLRDGMNLVAKEYVAAQAPQDPGVLILSRFAGAAQELDAALIVNPYDKQGVATAIARGLNMPLEERKERWRAMMDVLERNNVEDWSKSFLDILLEDQPQPVNGRVMPPLWTTLDG
jgi:trehalose 6-phosphate synthase